METLQDETDGNLNEKGEIMVFYECKNYGKQKPKDKPKEGDGRNTRKPQSENGGKWGHHEPVRERPADRDRGWKPWKKR